MLSYILIAISVSLATWLFMYLDSRLFDKPKTRMTYVKTITMTNIIVFGMVFMLTWLSPTKSIKDAVQSGGIIKKITDGPTTFINELGEEMLGGDAPF